MLGGAAREASAECGAMWGRVPVILLLACAAAGACHKGDAGPPPEPDVTPGPPPFVPGPLRDIVVEPLRIGLVAPDNLEQTVGADTLTLSAQGFPEVVIRVERSEQASWSGGGGGCREGDCSFERMAPCRRITCTANGAAAFTGVLPAICGSIESTFEPATPPGARALSTSGLQKNCDEPALAASQSLDPAIAGLLPEIDSCWKKHAGDNPAWRSGEVDVRLERALTEDGRATYGISAILSGLEGDLGSLQDCLDATIVPLRGHLPGIGNAVCAFAWDHRFALARDPSCTAEPEPPAADAGTSTPAPTPTTTPTSEATPASEHAAEAGTDVPEEANDPAETPDAAPEETTTEATATPTPTPTTTSAEAGDGG
jgi:hypothetical protein